MFFARLKFFSFHNVQCQKYVPTSKMVMPVVFSQVCVLANTQRKVKICFTRVGVLSLSHLPSNVFI